MCVCVWGGGGGGEGGGELLPINVFRKLYLHNNFRNLIKLTYLQLNRYCLITMQY